MIHEVKGNLITAPQLVIAHQVNCRGIMGAGVARAIREQWPQVYEEYQLAFNKEDQWDRPSLRLFSSVQFVDVPGHTIANMFSQYDYGTRQRQTNYEAFVKCCSIIGEHLTNHEIPEVAFPKYVGCGLAGGDWGVVRAIIESELKNFEVWLYEL